MLGNEEDARFIRDWYIEARRENHGYGAPERWVQLGSGCYRAAFLSPDGVVYKVEHDYSGYCYQSNETEAAALRKYMFRKLPKGCRFPRWSFFPLDGKSVIVMERFEKLLNNFSRYGNGSDYYAARDRLVWSLDSTGDWHGANIAVDEESELIVPIDLAG